MTMEVKEINRATEPCQSEIRAMRRCTKLIGQCYGYAGNEEHPASREGRQLSYDIGMLYGRLHDYCERHPLAKQENLYSL